MINYLSKKNLNKLPPLPEKVMNFDCSNNNLTDLIGSPSHVDGNFLCDRNYLTDLNGSPKYIGGYFTCANNQLTSLFGAPNIIKRNLYIRYNSNLLDVSDLWDSVIGGEIYFDLNPGMAILPLIKFEIYQYIAKIFKIHGRNRGASKQNILDFQYDLIENGFEKNARWKPE